MVLSAQNLEVSLLGGLPVDGRLMRSAHLRPITGQVEQQWVEIASAGTARPTCVSALLAAALDTVAGQPADECLVDALCVADRKRLMLQLAARMDGEQSWVSLTCERCGSRFDVGVDRSKLPTQPAGDGFPFAVVRVRRHTVKLRVPTGADQRWIAEAATEVTERDLLRRCLTAVDGEPPSVGFIDGLSDDEIDAMDAALDAVSPDIGTRLDVSCPECSHRQIAELDPYEMSMLRKDTFYEQVHTLAMNYHWSHQEILALPREQRCRYLTLIERSRGRHA